MVGDRYRSDWCREAEGPPTRTREFSISSHGRHSFSNNTAYLFSLSPRAALPASAVFGYQGRRRGHSVFV